MIEIPTNAEPVRVIEGDCARGAAPVLATLPADAFDSVVTDPPYELGFMGAAWDSTGVAFDPATWGHVLRVLRPGGYLLAMGGSRTYHRLTCAIEDAGFEIRDCLMWLYGTGYPKGKGCLKPGYEPIVLARKPGPKVLPLGIGACRVQLSGGEGRGRHNEASQERRYTQAGGTNFAAKPGVRGGDTAGRYPANVLHDGSDEVMEAFAAFGEDKGGGPGNHTRGKRASEACYRFNAHEPAPVGYADATGTAARFFYCSKASKSERGAGNNHATVKPLALMRWLVRLVTPPGGLLLDPFAGSGTTLLAAAAEGMRAVGIEQDAKHCEIIRRRLAAARAGPGLFDAA